MFAEYLVINICGAAMVKQNKDDTQEQFLNYIVDSIQMVVELNGRIDERVKMLVEKQAYIDEQLEKVVELQNRTINRLSVIEAKDIDSLISDLQKINETLAIIDNEDASGEIFAIKDKINKIERQIEQFENKSQKNDKFWEKVFDNIWKIFITIIATYIIYKLGIQV
jgi:hypothetical protein